MAKAKKDTAVPAATEEVVSVKGLDHEFKCRGHQFEIGKTYTVEGKVVACQNGFHAVDWDNPFHVWDFYPVVDDEGRLTRYAETIQSGQVARQEDEHKRGTKIASGSITVKVELSLPEFLKHAVERVIELTKGKGDDPSGDSARIGSSGNSAQIGSSGDYAQIGSSGYSAQIGSSGYSARIGSSGDSARIGSSGDSARIDASGDGTVVASAGINARVKAKAGTWVSVAEFDQSIPPKCIGFATGKVGEDGIPADTWLIAKGGKLVPENA